MSPLLSLAVSLGGVIATVVSSLLPCDGLPLAEDCDGGGLVPVLLRRAVCHGIVLGIPRAKDVAVGGHVPFFLSLDVHLGLVLGFWHNFLLFSRLR